MTSAHFVTAPSPRPGGTRLISLDWYRSMTGRAVHAFWASFAGWALDAFDYQVFPSR